jgi:hypothetical protein
LAQFGREIPMANTMSQAGVGPKTEVRIQQAAPPGHETIRNVALDAYRGFVMLLMMAEVLRLSSVAAAYPSSAFWRILAFSQTHVEWFGCSLHDTIQPGFSFLVGAALPYSLASRSCALAFPGTSRAGNFPAFDESFDYLFHI